MTRTPDGRLPLALVYRGPAASPGCPEAVAALLSSGPWDLDVRYTGPHESLPLSAESLSRAVLYAQPGGGTLDAAYRVLRPQRRAVRDFVHGGGHYLGFCLGAYLAGATPGFGLLPGDTDQYIATPGAAVHDEESTVVRVTWRGCPRAVYFQDGPVFLLDDDTAVRVLARYDNGTPAAVVAPFGAGRVAVAGPHPEATDDWYTDHGLPVQHTLDLARDLVESMWRE
ncbi:BPL-N domain-containing protein [Streptomyces sp. NPDC006184]|uniref:BPL-N domain-containing protein n=1 Tax=Streptomyces sp. NPDC006184 TaxID=3155455 RepID=UPI0033ABF9BE